MPPRSWVFRMLAPSPVTSQSRVVPDGLWMPHGAERSFPAKGEWIPGRGAHIDTAGGWAEDPVWAGAMPGWSHPPQIRGNGSPGLRTRVVNLVDPEAAKQGLNGPRTNGILIAT